MNSLDSQSSISSSCTITAEQESKSFEDETDIMVGNSESSTSLTAQAGSYTDVSASTSASVFPGDDSSRNGDDCITNIPPCQGDSSIQYEENKTHDIADGMNLPEYPSFKLPQSDYIDMPADICVDNESTTKMINPVLGIKKDDYDRAAPLFFIKPVNNEGIGLKGTEGERLEDGGMYFSIFILT